MSIYKDLCYARQNQSHRSHLPLSGANMYMKVHLAHHSVFLLPAKYVGAAREYKELEWVRGNCSGLTGLAEALTNEYDFSRKNIISTLPFTPREFPIKDDWDGQTR